MKTLSLWLLLAGTLFSCVSNSPAATWYIKPDGTGEAPTIQAGIDSTAAGDTVLLANGAYTGIGNRNLSYKGKAITVRSEGGNPALCVIDCGGTGYGFLFSSGEGAASLLDGIKVTNGRGSSGPAVGFRASPTVTNCTFSGNIGYPAGAAVCRDLASPTLVNCTFSDNLSGGDGAVWVYRSSPTFINCVFRDNSGGTDGAGAVSCDRGSPTFENCIFSGNSTNFSGGGIILSGGFVQLADCLFAGNSAPIGDGGAIAAYDSAFTIINCTIYGNSAGGNGSGMYFAGGPYPEEPRIQKSIFAFNNGEAFWDGGYCDPESTATMFSCCDVYGNTGGDWTACIAGGDSMNGNLSADPLFCDSANGDFTLAALSDCLPQNNTCGVLIGAYGLGCDVPVGIDILETVKPTLMLMQNYPNPFNPSTTISFTLPRTQKTNISIYNVEGKLITTLVDELHSAGLKEVTWDGKDANRNRVSSGVYFYRLTAGDKTLTKKMVLLK